MNDAVSCDDLAVVLLDQRRGHAPSPATAGHLASCARCREALAVDAAMQQVVVPEPSRLPTAGTVLLRARLAARRRAAERTQTPILVCQALTLVVALAAVAFVLGGGLPELLGGASAVDHPDLATSLLGGLLLAVLGLPFLGRLRAAL